MRSRPQDLLRYCTMLVAAAALGACAMFAPRYDAGLDTQASSAMQVIARIAANGQMGTYTDKASFPDARPQYADAIAQLAAARVRAGSLVVQGKGAVEARKTLTAMVKECSDRLISLAKMHQEFGIPTGDTAVTPVLISCNLALEAIQTGKPGA